MGVSRRLPRTLKMANLRNFKARDVDVIQFIERVRATITCSAAVTRYFYGARLHSNLCNFVLLRPIIIKLGVIDYVDNPYSYANFS